MPNNFKHYKYFKKYQIYINFPKANTQKYIQTISIVYIILSINNAKTSWGLKTLSCLGNMACQRQTPVQSRGIMTDLQGGLRSQKRGRSSGLSIEWVS